MKLEQDVCNGSKRKQIYKCGWLWQTGYYAKTKRKGGRGMREGWEYKKLNEVCDKSSSNIVINKLDDNNGDYPLFGASGLVKNVDFYHQDKPYIGIVKDGAGVGRVNTYPAYSSLVGTMQYIFPKEECLLNYVKYFLVKLDLSHCVSGATIPHIYFKDYGKELIPVPPLSTQLSIVSELDKISELIRLKKEQLKDYDNLAQSIFYEMFGDPVVNEKGWEVKRITDLCIEISAGGDASKHEIKKTKDEIFSVPVYSNGIDEDGLYGYSNHATINQPAITLAARGTIGAAFIRTEPYIPIIRLVSVIPDLSKISLTYLFYILKQTEWDRTGGTIPQLPVPKVKQLTLPLPPLPLQQLFAQRIELIEQQKAEIQSTIADLETLLASRMQYWFD